MTSNGERPGRGRYSKTADAARDAVTRSLTTLTPTQIDQAIPALFEMIAARGQYIEARTAVAATRKNDPARHGGRNARRDR